MRAFEAAATRPWYITEDSLRQILEIAARENPPVEAVAARLGRPLENSRSVTVRDGVAIVPITGPIFRRANMFTEISGATSTEMLAQDLQAALDDPKVQGILLEIDSPGGEAFGISELAGMIHAARQQKPVHAYVDGMGCSAAYWLASAAEQITLSSTAMVGSIGTVLPVRDSRARDERDGVRNLEFVSSQSPRKRPDPLTEEGAAQYQEIVDALTEVFVADVARNRGVPKATVLRDFGQGGVAIGTAAVDAGMADRVSTFEETLSALAAECGARKRKKMPDTGRMAAGADGGTPTGAATTERRTMEEQITQLENQLAAERGARADLETRLTAAESRANEADARAAQAQALAEVGAQALADVRTDYLAHCTQLGRSGAESQEVARLLAESGNYARLKQLRDEARAEVFARFPAKPSGDLRAENREEPQGDPGETLTAEDEKHIAALAERLKIGADVAKERYLATKRERLFAA